MNSVFFTFMQTFGYIVIISTLFASFLVFADVFGLMPLSEVGGFRDNK